jgi:transaldolase
MQFFIDTADIDEIKDCLALGVLDGVTTNPTLIARTGRPFRDVIVEICEIVPGPVSAEVIATEYGPIMEQARKLHGIHPNIVVKLPLTAEGLKATKTCSDEGIGTNVTLCFSPNQALLAAKAGASYISPFVGRLDDISAVGMDLIEKIVAIYANYDFDTQVLVASVRSPNHVVDAALMGADVCTIPHKVILQLVKHPLTDIGLANFLADFEKVPGGMAL